jgi:DNA-binding CsgD family transcriptional regulator
MGFISTPTRQAQQAPAQGGNQQERFNTYFSRVFAYGLSATGNEDEARNLTINAFAEAFAMPQMREAEFELEVFRRAREAARESRKSRQARDGLTPREREVLALVFDAQLHRDQVGSLLSLRPETVLGILLKGLRKMSDPMPANAAPPPIPSFYRA